MKIHYWIEGIRYALGIYWEAPTPHVIKRRVIKSCAKKYNIHCFIETGTYLGDMLAAMSRHFEELYSVELSEMFYRKAKIRFAGKPHIHLNCGDSASELARVLSRCQSRALFWLDAHYSGEGTARAAVDTPIMQEICHIFNHKIKDHVILIDDARCFTGNDNYPRIEQLRNYVNEYRPDYKFEVEQDIIQITPRLVD